MRRVLPLLTILLSVATIGQSQDSSLFTLSQNIDLELGSAFYYRAGWDEAEYENHFLENFNHLTPEGGMVWGEYGVSPDSGQINFWGGDRMIGFAHDNGLKVKAQHLVWHRYVDGADPLLPDWLITDDGVSQYPKEELSVLLKNFITETVDHYTTSYPETVKWWCVLNEAGSNTTGYIPNLWIDSLGPAHIDSSFAWARAAAGPDIKLYYNEYFYHGAPYGGARIPSKIDFAYDVVSGMVSRGVSIDGMGFQSHIPAIGYPGKATVASDMQRFTDLGLEVYITELDVELTTPVTQEKLEQQALVYKEMFEIALENPDIKLICLWQFNDDQSWLGAESESCIMDSAYNPKPAYDSIQAVLLGAGGLTTNLEKPIQADEALQINASQISILLTEPAILTISNLKGQVVNRLDVSKGDAIPIAHLSHDLYIATLETENRVWKLKFIP
jgi:endo-1,4-beta-xylanase